MIKLALSDLDSTLISFGEPCASARTLAAIHAVLDAGLHFGPVTGRLPADMDWMFDGDAACYQTGAFVNGMMVRVDGQIVYQTTLSEDLLNRVQNVLDSTALGYLTLYDPWNLDEVAYITAYPDRLLSDLPTSQSLTKTILPNVGLFPSSAPEGEPPSYAKANIHIVPRANRGELRDLLRREVPELDFVFPNPLAPLIDVTPKGWSKGEAVCLLQEALGLAPEEVAVFGDSENDLAMIQAVPNSVAVSNASEQVKAAARWQIGSCAEGAVDDALMDIAAASRTGEMPAYMHES